MDYPFLSYDEKNTKPNLVSNLERLVLNSLIDSARSVGININAEDATIHEVKYDRRRLLFSIRANIEHYNLSADFDNESEAEDLIDIEYLTRTRNNIHRRFMTLLGKASFNNIGIGFRRYLVESNNCSKDIKMLPRIIGGQCIIDAELRMELVLEVSELVPIATSVSSVEPNTTSNKYFHE